ncbi:MAG TPA: methyltransferase domain-containing protein [Steroidobacteraceae bacterium]|nr:methyltransferase domain-containing protein [Steroidobacteraceae bacterium]
MDAINSASPWHLLYREQTMRYLQAALPINGRILDAGGGTGIFATWLVELGHEVTVIDIVPEMLEILEEKRRALGNAGQRLTILPGDIESLGSLELGTFDAAICTQVLNFCRHPAAVFSGVAKVLARGGQFICDIDGAYRWSLIELLAGHVENARDILCEGADTAKNIVGTDYWFLEHRSVAQQLEAAGFHVLDMRGLLHFAPYIHVLAPSEEFLRGGALSSEGSMFVQPATLALLREIEQRAAEIMPIESAGWIQLVATLDGLASTQELEA